MLHSNLIAGVSLAFALLPAATVLAQVPRATSVVRNIVLVHGAFADGSSWSKVIPLLQEMGYHVVAVQNPMTSLADEVAFTKRIIALAIADNLNLSEETIKAHMRSIFLKLEANDRSHALAIALKRGIIEI